MKVYEHSLTEGGVATTDGPVTWFEEYPDPKGHSFKVLNGHITAVAGILDFYALTGEEKWKNLADRGIAAVKRDIAKYDAGFTTYYSADAPSLRPIAAIGQQYNSLHVDQMLWLYSISKDSSFLGWASRLQAYELNRDVYTANHSIDPVTNGPSQARALYGSAYWSDGTFPTWLEIKLPEVASLSGFWIDASGQQAAPRDFSISAKMDGEWRTIEEIKGNTGTRRVIKFQSEVVTDTVRLNIADDNGNHTVAIQAAMPIRATPQFAAITNDCNYLTGGGSYNYDLAMDDDPRTSMVVYCPGWVVIATHGKSRLTLSGSGKENAQFQVSASEGFDSWTPVQSVTVTREGVNVDLPHRKFARITFGHDVARIDQIKLQ